ncbi:uncharacterized protein isoform X2 [Bombus fervidus]|uniref:uncharacterized protein isoform X2 n=1 Tax=Bombus fervidus TaxID=203811 RepID=UPI003AB639AD
MRQKVQVPIRTTESRRCLPRPINPPDGYFSLQLPYGLPSGFQPYAASMNLPQKDEMKYLRNDGNLMNICFGCGKRMQVLTKCSDRMVLSIPELVSSSDGGKSSDGEARFRQ